VLTVYIDPLDEKWQTRMLSLYADLSLLYCSESYASLRSPIIGSEQVRIISRKRSILEALTPVSLLSLRQFDRGEPFIRKSWDKVLIVKVGSETAESEEVRP
jgi:hypothetical protein